MKAGIAKLIDKYAIPVAEDIIISLLNEDIQVVTFALKAAYCLSVNGHFSSNIFATASNNSSWSVRKNAVLRVIELNDNDSFNTLMKFQNPNYDPEYHETILSISNYIKTLTDDKKLKNSEITAAISFIEYHLQNSKLAAHNKERLMQTSNML